MKTRTSKHICFTRVDSNECILTSRSQGLANTYSAPPEPIDFAAYKAKIAAPGLVDKFEVRIRSRRVDRERRTVMRGSLCVGGCVSGRMGVR